MRKIRSRLRGLSIQCMDSELLKSGTLSLGCGVCGVPQRMGGPNYFPRQVTLESHFTLPFYPNVGRAEAAVKIISSPSASV